MATSTSVNLNDRIIELNNIGTTQVDPPCQTMSESQDLDERLMQLTIQIQEQGRIPVQAEAPISGYKIVQLVGDLFDAIAKLLEPIFSLLEQLGTNLDKKLTPGDGRAKFNIIEHLNFFEARAQLENYKSSIEHWRGREKWFEAEKCAQQHSELIPQAQRDTLAQKREAILNFDIDVPSDVLASKLQEMKAHCDQYPDLIMWNQMKEYEDLYKRQTSPHATDG